MRLAAVLLLLTGALGATGQTFGNHWLSMPSPNDTALVWFRHTFTAPAGRTAGVGHALLRVATTGLAEVYVNGRNVSTDCYMPARAAADTMAIAVTYDVTRFMRPDTNVVAVCYAPVAGRADRRQLSVDLYGETVNGLSFCYTTADAGWLCRPANRWRKRSGGEAIEGLPYTASYTDTDCDIACWLPAIRQKADPAQPQAERASFYEGLRHSRTRLPRYFDVEADTVVYDFGPGFYGTLRVTLRSARRGEHICIAGNDYICTGETDEQAILKFYPACYRKVTVTGDRRFRPQQIQQIEGLEMASYFHASYTY